ncbi:NYN domain-containing protein [Candidatus Saccharibacteria bacterium]|nr:NYN domain-containing protein [Candidatus Saccharibacteria bacterium]
MSKNNQPTNNQAFIDGQNLYINTLANNWAVDLIKFRIYLKERYNVENAYYFLGVVDEGNQDLYELIQKAGFILVFREHTQSMIGKKKGNVDTDIVFTIMSKIADNEDFNNVILVSGDGDYFKMVKYLINKGRFAKLLAPNRHSTSSLYRVFTPKYVDFLDSPGVKRKISLKES